MKLRDFRPVTFLKRDSNTGISCGYSKISKNSFFHRTRWLLVLLEYRELGCLFIDFLPPRAFDFDQKLIQNVAQIILYYHVTKHILPCLNRFITFFQFKNIFGKTLVAFDFDEKLTQSVAQITM